jgi:hypothetical protein
VLGTLASGGSPQSALVGIAVTSELEIIFDTVKNVRLPVSATLKREASRLLVGNA